jgi:hypothetical protein
VVFPACVTFNFFFTGLLVHFTVASGYRMRVFYSVFIFGNDSNKSKFGPGRDEEIEFG